MQWLKTILWGTESAWFWTMIQSLAVSISLPLIYRQIRAQVGQLKLQAHQLENQNTQLQIQTSQLEAQKLTNMLATLSSFDERWDSPELTRARLQICQQYLNHEKDIENPASRSLLHFFEELGTYFRFNVFTPEILWSIFTERICRYWEICEDKIRDHRANKADPTFYEDFEFLKNKMIEESVNRDVRVNPRTANEVRQFATDQIELLKRRLEAKRDE